MRVCAIIASFYCTSPLSRFSRVCGLSLMSVGTSRSRELRYGTTGEAGGCFLEPLNELRLGASELRSPVLSRAPPFRCLVQSGCNWRLLGYENAISSALDKVLGSSSDVIFRGRFLNSWRMNDHFLLYRIKLRATGTKMAEVLLL